MEEVPVKFFQEDLIPPYFSSNGLACEEDLVVMLIAVFLYVRYPLRVYVKLYKLFGCECAYC